MADGKDVVSECKDFDNIVRTTEIHTGNYNARPSVENPTTDAQSEGWNKAVWGSGSGVTQAWDTHFEKYFFCPLTKIASLYLLVSLKSPVKHTHTHTHTHTHAHI